MKTLFLSLASILFFSSFTLFAGNDEWTLYKTENGVQVFSKVIPCTTKADPNYADPNQEFLIFKIVNTNKNKMSVSWNYEVWYDGNCRTCGIKDKNNSEYAHKITLKGGETIEGNCQSDLKSGLMLFNGFQKKENSKKLSKFEMSNLTVSKTK